MRKLLAIFALIGLGASAPASADVTIRYRAVLPPTAPAQARETPPGLTITTGDEGQGRIEMSAPGGAPGAPGSRAPSAALITRAGVTYIALSGPQPGQQIVARLEDALALLTPMASGLAAGSAREGVQEMMAQRVEIVAGGAETVAGVRGNLHRVVIVSGETRSPPVEIVLSSDTRLAPAGRELVRLLDSLRAAVVAVMGGEPPPFASMRTLLATGTPLRIGTQLVLDSFSNEDVPDSRFDLPGPVMTREQLQQIMAMVMAGRGPGGDSPAPPATAPPSPQ